MHAIAKVSKLLAGCWLVSYSCPRCGNEHAFNGGPASAAPQGGTRETYCGELVNIKVTVKPT